MRPASMGNPNDRKHTAPAADDALLSAWANGDESAGEALFEAYFRQVARFFRNKTPDVAEDLIQRTFLALLESRARYRGNGKFRAFLFGVAHNVLREHLRQKRREKQVDFGVDSVTDLCAGPLTVAVKRREQQLLLDALRSIPVDDQVVLELYHVEQMTGVEIAETLQITERAVRSRLYRAKERLAEAAARLAASPRELRDTITDIDAWGASLRDPLGIDVATASVP